MSDRVNQINEALDILGTERGYLVAYDLEQQGYESWLEVTAAAREHIRLLTRLEDGSAIEAAAKWLLNLFHDAEEHNFNPAVLTSSWIIPSILSEALGFEVAPFMSEEDMEAAKKAVAALDPDVQAALGLQEDE